MTVASRNKQPSNRRVIFLLQYAYVMIQKDTVGDYFKCSKLTISEVFASTGIALIAFFLAILPTLVRYFHLTHAQTLLLDNIKQGMEKVLTVLDSLSFTNTVVTFLFWGVVGIVVYGLTAALVRLWQAGEEDKELVSDEYVHPTGFSKRHFWRQIIEKEALSAVILAAGLIGIGAAIFWAFPSGIMHVQALLDSFSIVQLSFVVLWTAIIAALFCLETLILKSWRYRHILFVV